MMKYWHLFLNKMIPYRGSIYRRIGGASVIDQLVNDFYFIMKTDPAALHCLATHQGRDLDHAAEKLKAFLSGWLGGPQIYLEKYGHPRLRMRHFPFPIGPKEAEEWLYCMTEALKKSSLSPEDQQALRLSFKGVTELIQNRS